MQNKDRKMHVFDSLKTNDWYESCFSLTFKRGMLFCNQLVCTGYTVCVSVTVNNWLIRDIWSALVMLYNICMICWKELVNKSYLFRNHLVWTCLCCMCLDSIRKKGIICSACFVSVPYKELAHESHLFRNRLVYTALYVFDSLKSFWSYAWTK